LFHPVFQGDSTFNQGGVQTTAAETRNQLLAAMLLSFPRQSTPEHCPRNEQLLLPKKVKKMLQEIKNLMLGHVSEVELVYKSKVKPSERITVREPADSYRLLLGTWDKDKIGLVEEFKVLYLNRANKVVAYMNLSRGGTTSTVVDPKLILTCALRIPVSHIIIAHNHPSGSLTPSMADEDLTQKLKIACNYHDIRLLDHIILNEESFFSFSEKGLI
jgi:DNA repair protein RadC